jgi:hypothetical protein
VVKDDDQTAFRPVWFGFLRSWLCLLGLGSELCGLYRQVVMCVTSADGLCLCMSILTNLSLGSC